MTISPLAGKPPPKGMPVDLARLERDCDFRVHARMQCGRSAAAVGEATTSAVVASVVSIVVAMAVITVVCNVPNI